MSSGLKATLCPCLLEPRAGLLQGLPPTRFCVPTTTLPGPSPFLCRTATVLCLRTERGLRGRRLRRLGSASHLPHLSDRDKPRAWWAAPGPAVLRTAPDPAPLTPRSHDRRLRSVGWEPALPWELGTRPGWGRLFLLLAGAGHRHRPECRRNPVCNPTRGSRCTGTADGEAGAGRGSCGSGGSRRTGGHLRHSPGLALSIRATGSKWPPHSSVSQT